MAFLAALLPSLTASGAAAAGTAAAASTAAAATGVAAGAATAAGTAAGAAAAGAAGTAAAATGMSLATKVLLGSTILSGGTAVLGGIQQKKVADAQAKQLRVQGKAEAARAGAEAAEERRQARYVSSRARAVAAASGAGATDPTVVNTIANLETEGEYRALMAMYNGEVRQNAAFGEASARRSEGSAARAAGFLRGASTILSSPGATDWLEKYG